MDTCWGAGASQAAAPAAMPLPLRESPPATPALMLAPPGPPPHRTPIGPQRMRPDDGRSAVHAVPESLLPPS